MRFCARLLFVLLLILLAAQAVYVYRAGIARMVPALRPALERACEPLHCRVPYARDIARIAITGSALKAADADADAAAARSAGGQESADQHFVLHATLRNQAEQPQEWPTLVLDLKDAAGTLQPGTYAGAGDGGVVLTVTTRHAAAGQSLTFPIRQSLYVDSSGVDDSQSVPASWLGGKPGATKANGFKVTSTGSTFNGVWVDGTTYKLTNPTLSLTGDGRDDFVADGAAVTGTNGANVTLDGAKVDDAGVVRTGVISTGGANVVVKNSSINASGGDLPSDYQINVAFDTMVAAPWMLGLEGTNRATLLMGDNSKASYVNSSITAKDWGALSTDSGSGVKLTSIDSTVKTLDSGYGSYLIGAATGDYLGTTMDVADYGIITANGDNVVNLGDSDASSVASLNTGRSIGLSDAELAALPKKSTTIDSGRIGVMTWAGDSTVNVNDHTTIKAGQAVFEDKTSTNGSKVVATYNVNGSASASPTLTSGRGVLMQVMSNDDPFPQSSYTDVTPVSDGYDLSAADADSRTDLNLTGTKVTGDVYNGAAYDKNLVLAMDGSTLKGVISSSTATHNGPVDPADYANIGDVSNAVSAPVNNGVIADLADGSVWKVTGTSYLTSLSLDATSSIVGAGGRTVTITQGEHTYSPADLVGQTITGTAADPITVSVSGIASSTTSVSVANTSYGTAGSARVHVLDGGGDPASGQVTVTVDGAKAGTATLDADGSATVALPATVGAGRHTVVASFASDDDTASGSGSTTYTVAQVGSTSKLTLAKKKVRRTKRAKATIAVTASTAPTGPVTVMKGSKVIARYTLAAARNGRLVVKLPKLTKPGKYHLRVVYGGNTDVTGSTSSKVTLKVIR